MRLIYDNLFYPCSIKSSMLDKYWYNMALVKLCVELPNDIYNKIKNDIKTDSQNNTLLDIFRFKLKLDKEDETNSPFLKLTDGYWSIESNLNRMSISGETKSKVIAHFEISIHNSRKLEKSEYRDILLDQILP